MSAEEKLVQYTSSCQQAADGFIERATRFGAGDLTVTSANPYELSFKVSITYDLEVISEATDYKGVIKPSGTDFGTADWSLYQKLAQEQLEAEFARDDTRKELAATVESKAYAAINSRTSIRTHPRRLFHTYTCNTCHGCGKVSCHSCGGSGAVTCGSCGGSGRRNCSACGGSGSVTEHHQVKDYSGHYRSETRRRSCYSCSGGRVTCSGCGGTGRNTCGTCGGTGKLTCQTCDGHGYLTRIITTTTYATPSFHAYYPDNTAKYVHPALNKTKFDRLATLGTIEYDRTTFVDGRAAVAFYYRSAIKFCEMSLQIHGHESNWVIYGQPPQIYDAGGIVETLLQDDLDNLEAAKKSARRYLPWFHRDAKKAIQPFMESEANQDIVTAHTQNKGPGEIVDVVNRSVSETYIAKALGFLDGALRPAMRWSSIKWALAMAILSVPIIMVGITVSERSQVHTILSTQSTLVLFPFGSGPQLPWGIAALTLPISLLGWLTGRWLTGRWIKKIGGSQLLAFAHKRAVLFDKWVLGAMVIAAGATAAAFFMNWPMWLDRDGRLYGAISAFDPPVIATPPSLSAPKASSKAGTHHKPRKKQINE